MSQETFFAQQEDCFSSFHNYLQHIGELQKLQARNLQDGIRRRQEKSLQALAESAPQVPNATDWLDYLSDFNQRTLLFWDTLRQRADNTLNHRQAGYPVLLKFDHELLLDGRSLPSPVNYSLLRILPGVGQMTDVALPPVIVIDPRGGHGAGIGGFKEESEIGESLRAGHPTYFIAFSHTSEPGQTLGDVAAAQARFIELVSERHAHAGKPVLIGNCQAGWALMGLAALRPELPGLVVVVGAPLSYWAGTNGRNPMRYAGGLLGGAWMTRLGSDLGNGRFDGTWLVSNFENLDPAHALWGKYYELFSSIDSEAPRFLDFERWWGSPNLFNSEEIEVIVDDLFIGNRLTGARGSLTDLRKIEAPVVVFCSYGDNITPPQQALNWIVDLYPNDLALHSAGRTIIYLKHASIGHLGIFVSGKVARREHRQLIGAIDAIKALPPGLFELIIDDVPHADDRTQAYKVHFEPRRIADIVADDDGRDDEREFALVERVSAISSTYYDWTVRPWLSRAVDEPGAELLRQSHPFHQQRLAWSSLNPALWWLSGTAELARRQRRPVRADNPLLAWQELVSGCVENALDTWRDFRDAGQELAFHMFYGGLSTLASGRQAKSSAEPASERDRALIARLHEALPLGDAREAAIRILLLLARASGRLDKDMLENIVKDYRRRASSDPQVPDVASLRETTRLQNLLVFAYPEESLQSLPELLPEPEERQRILAEVVRIEPDWQRSDGPLGELWRQLFEVLELPQADFARLRAELPAPAPEVIAEASVAAPSVAAEAIAEESAAPAPEPQAQQPAAEAAAPQVGAEAPSEPAPVVEPAVVPEPQAESVAEPAIGAAAEPVAEPVAAEPPAEVKAEAATKPHIRVRSNTVTEAPASGEPQPAAAAAPAAVETAPASAEAAPVSAEAPPAPAEAIPATAETPTVPSKAAPSAKAASPATKATRTPAKPRQPGRPRKPTSK
ncbi:Protein of unknown function [Azotobacter beijerinckii]|uniref:Poly(3-hydroxyalkanoate) synthetase n=1 Tax=Azotobacter beijerinckii TaxID=170623 RepID=A0A1H9IJ72_9GAMM|nr:DUF3141 domain-containing protein [Azotobacter beijerinckii]SEQ74435.1 Protein of unknown function [Azotobacter beijerinckii]